MLINRVGGGGENVTAEVNTQTPLVQDIATMLAAAVVRPSGTHLWAKFTDQDGVFIELVLSSDPDAYPDGDVKDGYYYQKMIGVVGTDSNGTYMMEL